MIKIDELEDLIRHYRWLEDIAKDYESILEMMDREKDYFRIHGFSYSARGDVCKFSLNCHRTIPYTYVRDGIQSALNGIISELKECENKLKDFNIDNDDTRRTVTESKCH